MTAAIRVEDVSKRFRVYHERNQSLKSVVMRRRRARYEEFWALKDVSFEVTSGRTFGLIGDNGSGKSTLLKCIAGILTPDKGSITATGRTAALLEVGSGFHPELSGRDNVYLNASILGMSRKEIDAKFDEIVAFSGVEKFIDQPVKDYSSGMYVRLGFSVAIHVDPEILLVDEVLAVGDAGFQEKCLEKFAQFRREGRTVVVVSHSLPSLAAMCDEVAWLDHGDLVEQGPAAPVLDRYHDVTRAGRRQGSGGLVHTGSGEAEVLAVDLLRDGEPTVAYRPGDPMTVRIAYRAHERITNPVFGLALDARDGTHLWANNTRDVGHPIEAIEGEGVVECHVPSLALQAGTYDVTAAITDRTTTHVFDYVRAAASLTVSQEPDGERGGYVAFGGRWTT